MAGVYPNGLLCDAGAVQIVALSDGAKADATVVIGEKYRVFAPMIGVVALGYSDPNTVGNIIGLIPPGGFVDITVTATTLMIICEDTTDDYGTDFDANTYVVKISDNA